MHQDFYVFLIRIRWCNEGVHICWFLFVIYLAAFQVVALSLSPPRLSYFPFFLEYLAPPNYVCFMCVLGVLSSWFDFNCSYNEFGFFFFKCNLMLPLYRS